VRVDEPADRLDAKLDQYPVDEPGLVGPVHRLEQHRDDRHGQELGEEEHHPVETRPPDSPPHAAARATAHVEQVGDDQCQRDRDQRQRDQDDPVVAQRLPEDRVGEHVAEVLQPGPLRFAEPAPLLRRHVERLQVRAHHEDRVQQQGWDEEREDERVPAVPHDRYRPISA
jgi:hypothetical protein